MDTPAFVSFLQQRNAAARLCEPAPAADELDAMLQAAMRVPDHGRLQPWRFLLIDGQGREALGELFVEAQRRRAGMDDEKAASLRQKPLRAPLIVVVIACLQQHPKAPIIEQQLSAGCAAHNLLLAAEALGYAGIWRTGSMAFDAYVAEGLGLAANEQIIGFVYIGSRAGERKPLPVLTTDDFVRHWPAGREGW